MEGEENSWNKKTPWSNDSIQLLLKLWEEHEELYNIKHQHYQNKHRRWAALRNIANKLSCLRPNTSPEDIKHKMNIIRTQYGSDLKRFITEENRQPTIWWFELAGFLNKYIKHRKEGGTSGNSTNAAATASSNSTKVGGIKKEITNEEFIQHYQKQQLHHHLQQQQLQQLAQQTNELKKKYDKNEIEIIPSFASSIPSTPKSSSPLAASSSTSSVSSLATNTTTATACSPNITTQSSSSLSALACAQLNTTGSTTINTLPMQTAPLALKHQQSSTSSAAALAATIPNVVSHLKRKFDESHYQSNLKHFHNQHQLNHHRKSLNHLTSITGTSTSLSVSSNLSSTGAATVQSNKNMQYKCDDEYDIVGRNVALKLSNMKVRQKVFAEKLISDILYYGQLDLLNLTTTIIIGDDLEEDDDDYSSNDTDPLNFVDVTTDGPADSTKIE